MLGAAGPDLLSVDDPVARAVLGTHGAGAKPGEVGTTRRFREQLAPDLLARRQRWQKPLLLFLAGPGHHRRAAHAVADDEGPGQRAVDALLLAPDHPLDRRAATAAVLL